MVMDLVYGGGGAGLNFRHHRPAQVVAEIHKAEETAAADPDDCDEQIDEAAKRERVN